MTEREAQRDAAPMVAGTGERDVEIDVEDEARVRAARELDLARQAGEQHFQTDGVESLRHAAAITGSARNCW